MATQQTESDGDLWFFTQASAAKAEEIRANPHVNASYASLRENRYVLGEAELMGTYGR